MLLRYYKAAHPDTRIRNKTNERSQLLPFLPRSDALNKYLSDPAWKKKKKTFEDFNELYWKHESFIAVN